MTGWPWPRPASSKTRTGGTQDGKRPVFRAPQGRFVFRGMLACAGHPCRAAGAGHHRQGSAGRAPTFCRALTCRQNPKVRWILRDGEPLPPEPRRRPVKQQDDQHALAHHQDPRQLNLIGMHGRVQGRALDYALSDRAPLFPGVDQCHRVRLDLAGRALQGGAVPVRRIRPTRAELISRVQERMKSGRPTSGWPPTSRTGTSAAT